MFRICLCWLSIGALISSPVGAQSLSYNGVSGFMRIPDANVVAPATFNYQFNTIADLPGEFRRTNNHVFSIGLGDYFEAGGRLTDWYDDRAVDDDGTRGGIRDLSGNFKVRLPVAHDGLPALAFGILDFAGEAQQLTSYFASASKNFGGLKLDVSAGIASGDSERALDGFFAGAKWQATPAFAVMADFANEQPGFGLQAARRFPYFSISTEFSAQREESGEWDRTFAVTATAPFERRGRNRPFTAAATLAAGKRDIDSLAKALAQAGLSNLRISSENDIDVFSFENQVFNHNHLDAFAFVLGTAYRYLGRAAKVRVTINKTGIPLLSIETLMSDWGEFAKGELSEEQYKSKLVVWKPVPRQVDWSKSQNPAFNRATRRYASLRLQPDIRSVVGSEFGVLDYSLAVRGDLSMPLPRGDASVLLSASVPVTHTELYDEGEVFGTSLHRASLNQVVVQKFLRPSSASSLLFSGGYTRLLDQGYMVLQGEGIVSTPNGKGQFEGKLASLGAVEDRELQDQLLATIGYQHFWRSTNASVSVITGQFFDEERGTKVEVGRFYGDVRVAAFVNYAGSEDISGGLRIALPLTPVRDRLVSSRLIVRGSQHWQYEAATTIRDPVFRGTNRVRPNMLFDPVLSLSLSKDYLDNDRIDEGYVRANINRLRAYVRVASAD